MHAISLRFRIRSLPDLPACSALVAILRVQLKVAIFFAACGLWVGPSGRPSQQALADEPIAPQEQKSPVPEVKQAQGERETEQDRARRLALQAHAQAAIHKLPRFSYQARYRHGIVDSMRAVDISQDLLRQGLTAPVLEQDWLGWYQLGFSWDEQRFLSELRPGETVLHHHSLFWTATDAWERREANDKSSVVFVRMPGPAQPWKSLHLFDYSYLRFTPHRYWWGQTARINLQTLNPVPPEKASWRHLGTEMFGGEMCELVESPQRSERLWIGQDSQRLRGVFSYYTISDPTVSREFYKTDVLQRIAGKTFASLQEYGSWHKNATEDQLIQIAIAWADLRSSATPAKIDPNELIQLDDYREIAPGLWLPLREVRTFRHASEAVKGKSLIRRSELRVGEVRTDLDLRDRCAELLPKGGEQVQDQRFAVPLDLQYRADRTDDEIRKMAEGRYQQLLEGQEALNRLVRPIEALVGKPAPPLPEKGWIGGSRPDVTGKPYLLHFWAAWCGPCKNDLPRLKDLAGRGVIILGMHPAGTPAGEIEKVISDHQLGYPTFVATGETGAASYAAIGEYPAGAFPYSIFVDAQGRVAGHGSLSALLEKFGVGALIAPSTEDAGK